MGMATRNPEHQDEAYSLVAVYEPAETQAGKRNIPGTRRDLISAMTPETWALNDSKGMPVEQDHLMQQEVRPASEIVDILFEQLDYLIQFAEQECGRLERVKAILMEPFR